ncbi:hypothetical protein GJ699_00205 [Duganella sp. FT80W]|uniref:Uncharacterized protein n=1 Tax=Duganella guangzhouensis TaxID=2666084 RepID=A0A6I2KRW8_9BURK|nr:hypothetical protein [Duganella guangzhouensis]MRW88405.1 hypothetical protein [Duganella guangzhouensis]
MKRIATSSRMKRMVLWLQCVLLLCSLQLPGISQSLPLQMEMPVAASMEALPTKAPAVDCKSFSFCCIAPPVTVRAIGTPERSNTVCGADAWQREPNGHAAVAISRPIASPSVTLRVLYCCWRN